MIAGDVNGRRCQHSDIDGVRDPIDCAGIANWWEYLTGPAGYTDSVFELQEPY